MTERTLRCFLLWTAAILVAGVAFAQTGDDQTPANEGVCDPLINATPGLYGLCVAFCEAQDLDLESEATSNPAILSAYHKKQQPGDPEMPCLMAPCPCWSPEESAVDQWGARGGAVCQTLYSGPGRRNDRITEGTAGVDGHRASLRVEQRPSGPSYSCVYGDDLSAPPLVRSLQISAEEYDTCLFQLGFLCEEVGMPLDPQ